MKNAIIIFALILAALMILLVLKRDWARAAGEFLNRDKIPIWLSMSLAIAAAAGTYWIAPLINENFEFQKNRSAYLLETVDGVNKSIIDLTVDIRKFDNSLFYKKSDIEKTRGELLDQIAMLQWQLVDVGVVISRVNTTDTTASALSKQLDLLRTVVVNARRPEDQELIIEYGIEVDKKARVCINSLYSSAKLD